MADKNQPAFPIGATVPDGNGMLKWEQVPGMTLRQYYAGQALTGIMANPSYSQDSNSDIAIYCKYIADALIAELDK